MTAIHWTPKKILIELNMNLFRIYKMRVLYCEELEDKLHYFQGFKVDESKAKRQIACEQAQTLFLVNFSRWTPTKHIEPLHLT